MNLGRLLILSWVAYALLAPFPGWAADVRARDATDTGVSGLWILANISYAGMRAQNSSSKGWRIISFIFGFPGTLISLFAVREGGGRAYGIDLPGNQDYMK